jgi:uncharacterized membrane protein YfcA
MPGMNHILLAHSPTALLFILGVFILAGTVKGVVGLGLPTVAVGLLGIVMAPREAAALLVVPSLVTNLWQLAAGPGVLPLVRRLWPMLAGICVGTLAGGALLPPMGSANGVALLGGALIVYAISGLTAFTLHVTPRAEPVAGPLTGLATGLITAATGVFVIPAVPYLGGLTLERDALIQALGLAFTASTCALAVSLLAAGAMPVQAAGTSVLAVAPALAGMWFGQRIRAHIRPQVFRRCFFTGLLGLGLHLALRPFLP